MHLKYLLLGAAIVAAPAHAGLLTAKAQPGDSAFAQCDGYAAPGKKSDGITVGTWMFGLGTASVDERRRTTKLGQDGLTACETALADPRIQPFATRRGHLWQAKAIHLISLGKFDDALVSLDRSDQEGRSEPFFDLSIGQGNRALRAVSLHGKGKKVEAESMLDELERRRPYAVSQRQMAMRIRLQFEDDRKKQAAILEKMVPLFPSASHMLFWQSMIYGEFEPALRYAASVSYDDPKRRGGWKSSSDFDDQYLDVVERSEFAGAVAYALYVSGNIGESATRLKQAEDYVESYMVPPPPPEPGQKWSRKVSQDYGLRKATGARALGQLKTWRSNIALRSEAPKLDLNEIKQSVDKQQQQLPMISDILRNARADTPDASRMVAEVGRAVEQTLDESRLKKTRMDFQDLVALLPRPETARNQIRFRQENGILGSGLDGFAVKRNQPPGAATVRYGTATGSMALADEGALLAAARHAEKEGMDAFLVDARNPIQRTTSITTCYYACGAAVDHNSGYEVQLVIRPMATGSAGEFDRLRLIRTADVVGALAPRLTPVPAGSGK
jgi:hypothetical protein